MLGCEWLGSWKVDNSHTQTDRSGWSYALSYDFLISNCEKGASLTIPGALHNSRRRKWIRRARRAVDPNLPPPSVKPDPTLPFPATAPAPAPASSSSALPPTVSADAAPKPQRPDDLGAQRQSLLNHETKTTQAISAAAFTNSKPAAVRSATDTGTGLTTVVEAFENERRGFKGFSSANLFLHPRFSDASGKKNLKYSSLKDAPPPPGEPC